MTEETVTETITEEEVGEKSSILEKFKIQSKEMFIWTLFYSLLGIGVFVLLSLIPEPFIMISLFKFGFIPALAIIAVVGAIRGPLAGFLTGYLGTIVYDFLIYRAIVTMTLPAFAYGVLGFVVGLASYDLSNGRSLIKLSIISAIGFIFTVLLIVILGLYVESYATLVVLGFVMLPLMTMGLPTLILLAPLLGRSWYLVQSKITPSTLDG